MITANELRLMTGQAIKERKERAVKACETLYMETIEPELVRVAKLGYNAHTFKKELLRGVTISTLMNYLTNLGFQVKNLDGELTVSW